VTNKKLGAFYPPHDSQLPSSLAPQQSVKVKNKFMSKTRNRTAQGCYSQIEIWCKTFRFTRAKTTAHLSKEWCTAQNLGETPATGNHSRADGHPIVQLLQGLRP